MVLTLDIQNRHQSEYDSCFLSCYRYLASAMIMFKISAFKSGTSTLKKILKKTKQYEFFHLGFVCAKFLRNNSEAKEFDFYNKLTEEYREKLFLEEKIDNHYQSFRHYLTMNRFPTTEYQEELGNAIKETRRLFFNIAPQSIYLDRKISRLNIIWNKFNDSAKCFDLSNMALKKYSQHPLKHDSFIRDIVNFNLTACIELKKYIDGEEAVHEWEKVFPKETEAWYNLQNQYFILLLHSQQYDKALTLYYRITENSKFYLASAKVKELWKVNAAYLHFIIKSDLISSFVKTRVRLNKFSLGKYLNEVSILEKDKKGMNTAILVSKVIILLQRKEYYKLIGQLDSLKVYARRYLKEDRGRTYYFFQMITLMFKSDFNPNKISQEDQKYLQLLHRIPIEISPLATNQELIPYPLLWKLVKLNLDKKSIAVSSVA